MRFVHEEKILTALVGIFAVTICDRARPRPIVAAMSARARNGLQLFTEEYVGTIHHIQKTSDHLYGGHSAVCKCSDRNNPEFSSQRIVQMA
jgi:hypothetical protein